MGRCRQIELNHHGETASFPNLNDSCMWGKLLCPRVRQDDEGVVRRAKSVNSGTAWLCEIHKKLCFSGPGLPCRGVCAPHLEFIGRWFDGLQLQWLCCVVFFV